MLFRFDCTHGVDVQLRNVKIGEPGVKNLCTRDQLKALRGPDTSLVRSRWGFECFDGEEQSGAAELGEICKVVELLWLLNQVEVKGKDNTDYELVVSGMSYAELNEEVKALYEMGDVRRLLTKRFIKTVRGSSYEVDLRMHESQTLLQNIKQELVKEIIRGVKGVYFNGLKVQWKGPPLSLLLVDGLNLSSKTNIEVFFQDAFLLQSMKLINEDAKTTPIYSEVLRYLHSKLDLKFVNLNTILTNMVKLEETGLLRPNMNNNKGFIGFKPFHDLNYFKLYNFEDVLLRNSSYSTKDVEDAFGFVGLPNKFEKMIDTFEKDSETIFSLIKSSSSQLILFNNTKCNLKDRIINTHLNLQTRGRQENLKQKMKKILQQAVDFTKSSKLISKHTNRTLTLEEMKDFFDRLCRISENWEQTNNLSVLLCQNWFTTKAKRMALKSMKDLNQSKRKIKSMCRYIQKLDYINKLSCKVDTFLTIKKFALQTKDRRRNAKALESVLSKLFKDHKKEDLSLALCMFKARVVAGRKLDLLDRMAGKLCSGWLRTAFRRIYESSVESKYTTKTNEFQRYSVLLLRKNYLLNNMVFIFKLKASVMANHYLKEAFQLIKQVYSEKRSREDCSGRLLKKMTSILERRVYRMGFTAIKKNKDVLRSQNYKLAFHFLQMYIVRKSFSNAFQAINIFGKRFGDFFSGVQKLDGCIRHHYLKEFLKRLVEMKDKKRGIVKLMNFVRYKDSINKQICGKLLFEHLKSSSKMRLRKLRDSVVKGTLKLKLCFKQVGFNRIKEYSTKKHSAVNLLSIQLELIFLKNLKKNFKEVFSVMQLNMAKKKRQEHRAGVIRHKAATKIQSWLKAVSVRLQYSDLRRRAMKVQRAVRAYLKRQKELKMEYELTKQRQKERMTHIRETALSKLKENFNAPKIRKEEKIIKNFEQHESLSRQATFDDTFKTHDSFTGHHRGQPFPLTHSSFVKDPPPRPPLKKFNNENQSREYVKHYKNKVINNHIKEREKAQNLLLEESYKENLKQHINSSRVSREKQSSVQKYPPTTAKDNGSKLNTSQSDIQEKKDNLHELVMGVKQKISQIRRTERAFQT
jgi:hypothetical protein